MPEGRTGQFLAIRFLPGNISDNIAFLENTWKKFKMEGPFKYSFFDQEFENLYNKEKRLAHIFTFFCLLAIFIACLGIFGLAAFTAEQRTKEIGIRKVMGASIQNIVEILSRIYLKLIIIAVLFACPIGYVLMNKWLTNFPFRANIGVIVFILTIVVTLIIVISSVSYHSIKAAMTNPARTLKYE
jgi:putative ABC transport system permease protein